MSTIESGHACSVEGCSRPHLARGLCGTHYARWYNRGTIDLTTKPETFEDKYEVDGLTGCWVWVRGKNKNGYGICKHEGHSVLAHRYSWTRSRGAIPKGMLVCHSCDNPPCVNPEHLFLGSYVDNNHDRKRKGRSAVGQKNGRHKYPAHVLQAARRPDLTPSKAFAELGISKSYFYYLRRGG